MMNKFLFNITIMTILATSLSISAQTDTCTCCNPNYNQFDFWVGNWVVKNRIGKELGRSKIQKLENNCLVLEKWSGTNNSSGRSFNYFDQESKTWNQLWLSNKGNILKLEGQIKNDKMVLTGPWERSQKGSYRNQIIWTPQEDGTVTQEWILLFEDDDENDTLFFGVYHRSK